jgi:hypothetical protein
VPCLYGNGTRPLSQSTGVNDCLDYICYCLTWHRYSLYISLNTVMAALRVGTQADRRARQAVGLATGREGRREPSLPSQGGSGVI